MLWRSTFSACSLTLIVLGRLVGFSVTFSSYCLSSYLSLSFLGNILLIILSPVRIGSICIGLLSPEPPLGFGLSGGGGSSRYLGFNPILRSYYYDYYCYGWLTGPRGISQGICYIYWSISLNSDSSISTSDLMSSSI